MPNEKGDQGSRHGEISQEDRDAFRARASEIGRRLEDVEKRKAPEPGRDERGAALGQAFRIAIEMVAGVLVGTFVGWYLDRALGTSGPWFLIGCIILGFAGGMWNVIRTAQRMQAQSEHLQRSAPSVKDDREKEG